MQGLGELWVEYEEGLLIFYVCNLLLCDNVRINNHHTTFLIDKVTIP